MTPPQTCYELGFLPRGRFAIARILARQKGPGGGNRGQHIYLLRDTNFPAPLLRRRDQEVRRRARRAWRCTPTRSCDRTAARQPPACAPRRRRRARPAAATQASPCRLPPAPSRCTPRGGGAQEGRSLRGASRRAAARRGASVRARARSAARGRASQRRCARRCAQRR